jgi:hypothetical protein
VPRSSRGARDPVARGLAGLRREALDRVDLIRELFGDEIADRGGPTWGFGDGEELRNMFTRTPQPGLWFIAGSFAQCRIYSKYLALQIKACETGLLS